MERKKNSRLLKVKGGWMVGQITSQLTNKSVVPPVQSESIRLNSTLFGPHIHSTHKYGYVLLPIDTLKFSVSHYDGLCPARTYHIYIYLKVMFGS